MILDHKISFVNAGRSIADIQESPVRKKCILHLCPFIGPISRGLDFFKLWILPNNCLVYGLTFLDLDSDLGYAKTGEIAQQPKAEPNWQTLLEAYVIELRWLKVYHTPSIIETWT